MLPEHPQYDFLPYYFKIARNFQGIKNELSGPPVAFNRTLVTKPSMAIHSSQWLGHL